MHGELSILYEDNHLLVVNKPAGIATMGTPSGTVNMVTSAASYLKRKYAKPGNVFVGVVSRLDSLVSGVLVLARTSKAASRLSEQLRDRQTDKLYLAWVEGKLTAPSHSQSATVEHPRPDVLLVDRMSKDESRQRMELVASGDEGLEARLRYRLLTVEADRSLLQIRLETGRKHQIRVQLAAHCGPILGDTKYGAARKFSTGIALHCLRMTVKHPTRDEHLAFTAPIPEYWPRTTHAFAAQCEDKE
ncbi:MAG: RNA pseudouridine synthase [Pirellulales bacterium]